ncbi:hypothetical protein A500_17315 [Clostridium sartagoforme AAU1]|uniref:Uncharacterized protein n=1 Tax=Clostridium sartagoforme AAU1 TaxID=1202534 RepID=R9BZP3_9CLOT|nr:hypothetical protein [Clostridium sartagoforme]EOR20416.1 hypothetical protein A500_17315 [Clostridium sartagoforme AAU1]
MDVLGFVISVFSGVVGNSVYNFITEEDIELKLTRIYHLVENLFCEKYGNKYGDYSNSFLLGKRIFII